MSNRFYFDDDSSGSENNLDSLPYPKPLSREAFLTPDFDPTTFLSTLHNRFQTLEDLRAELRTRSQDLNKELLDLVNENYQDFLSLGSSLKGGDEKIEEVKLRLLGFRREVEGLKDKIANKKAEVGNLIDERKSIRTQIDFGRSLLEVDTRIKELEERLMLESQVTQKPDDMVELSESDDESEDDFDGSMSMSRLRRHAEQYLYLQRLVDKLGSDQPFLRTQDERLLRLKRTILLDLGSALKQVAASQDSREEGLLKIIEIYRIMGEFQDAVKIMKEIRASSRGTSSRTRV